MSAKKYRSCWYIESSLILHPRHLYHCCIPVAGSFGSTMITEFHGGDLPLEKIRASRQRYRDQLAHLETDEVFHCKACVHHHEREWDEKYLFNMLHFNHSMICNLHCNFCVQRSIHLSQQKPDYDALPICEQLVKSDWLSPNAFIFWAGGEPTLLDDFAASLNLMMAHGTRNEVATNSTVYCDAIFRHLAPDKKLVMKTSIDCGSAETYHRMKGADLYDTVWENLAKYNSTGGEVSAKYIISHDNISESDIEGFIVKVIEVGIRYCHIDINHNFKPGEVTDKHVNAAVRLTVALREAGVEVCTGVHSTASVPDFKKRVEKGGCKNECMH
jgi:sulfatase maturation enzyme AslB (radical SAM superfamily)